MYEQTDSTLHFWIIILSHDYPDAFLFIVKLLTTKFILKCDDEIECVDNTSTKLLSG